MYSQLLNTGDEINWAIDRMVLRSVAHLENRERWNAIKAEYLGEPCPICGVIMYPLGGTECHSLSTEHILPRTLGGTDSFENLIVICRSCNLSRNEVMHKLLPYLKEMRGKRLCDEEILQIRRFIAWSLRSLFTPGSKNVDSELYELFNKIRAKKNKFEDLRNHLESDRTYHIPRPILRLQFNEVTN